MPNQDFSKITVAGSTYSVKDATARQMIEALESPVHFLGVTTTPLTDGGNTNPIIIGGKSTTITTAGNFVIYGDSKQEFINTLSGSTVTWHKIGDASEMPEYTEEDYANITYTRQQLDASHTDKAVVGAVTVTPSALSGEVGGIPTGISLNTTKKIVGTSNALLQEVDSMAKAGTQFITNVTNPIASLEATYANETLSLSALVEQTITPKNYQIINGNLNLHYENESGDPMVPTGGVLTGDASQAVYFRLGTGTAASSVNIVSNVEASRCWLDIEDLGHTHPMFPEE